VVEDESLSGALEPFRDSSRHSLLLYDTVNSLSADAPRPRWWCPGRCRRRWTYQDLALGVPSPSSSACPKRGSTTSFTHARNVRAQRVSSRVSSSWAKRAISSIETQGKALLLGISR